MSTKNNEKTEGSNDFYALLCGVNSHIIEGLLIWISEFCGSKGFRPNGENKLELKWYLKEEADTLYDGVNSNKLPLYTSKEMMLKYYDYTI